jgi:microcystin-dependent protein
VPVEPFVGEVQTFSFSFAPQGWLPCDGRLLQITQFRALFSLIGNTYGGDGQSTFAVPKLAPLGPDGPNFFIAVMGTFPQR